MAMLTVTTTMTTRLITETTNTTKALTRTVFYSVHYLVPSITFIIIFVNKPQYNAVHYVFLAYKKSCPGSKNKVV